MRLNVGLQSSSDRSVAPGIIFRWELCNLVTSTKPRFFSRLFSAFKDQRFRKGLRFSPPPLKFKKKLKKKQPPPPHSPSLFQLWTWDKMPSYWFAFKQQTKKKERKERNQHVLLPVSGECWQWRSRIRHAPEITVLRCRAAVWRND